MKINKNRHCKKDVKTGVTTVVSYHASGYNRAPFLIFFFLAVLRDNQRIKSEAFREGHVDVDEKGY